MACSICREEGHNRRTCPELGNDEDESKRSRGGQPGNTNALKHGLYSERFTVGEIEILETYSEEIDLSHEINMLRVMIYRALQLVESDKDDMDITEVPSLLHAISRAAKRIGGLVKVQHVVFGDDGDLDSSLESALKEVAEELGLV